MELLESQKIFSFNIACLLQEIHKKGYSVTFGEAYRTKEQAEIYAKEGKGILHSLHCERLAVDLNIFAPDGKELLTKEELEQFGKLWEFMNPHNRWGGHFTTGPDSDHYQMTPP